MDTREDTGAFYPGGKKVPQGPIVPKEPVTSYNELSDRPAIGGKTLTKDSTAAGLGLSTEGHTHLLGDVTGLGTRLNGIDKDIKDNAEEIEKLKKGGGGEIDLSKTVVKKTEDGSTQTIENGIIIHKGLLVQGGVNVAGGLLDVSKSIVIMTPPDGTYVVTTDGQLAAPGPAAWIGDGIALNVQRSPYGTVYSEFVPFRSLLAKLNSLRLNIDGTTISSTQLSGVATLAFNVDGDVFAYDDESETPLQKTDKPRLRFKLKGEIEQIKSIIEKLDETYAKKTDIPDVDAYGGTASDVCLTSPDGTKWTLTVNDDGTLSTKIKEEQ